ncbi:hypothetical protein HMPREF9446_03932 [Bacteroides fluxus YIT 12057]|uniref:Uncharacterized protein n=1 Tax=Bacteroides fluxus YIT 12057 TaxID=763034 RepID=F3PYX4_9BACE|nr:hypothetical protein HMPREF9446_03932 [Bacteroides fluxus YIT 12057]
MAEKIPERSEDDFFLPTSPQGPPCLRQGKKLSLQGRIRNICGWILEELLSV